MKHCIRLLDLSRSEIEEILQTAADLKARWSRGVRSPRLAGRVLTQVFDKPSLRTRVSFEAAMMQLGGNAIFLSSQEAGLHGRESLADVARVLSAYSDAVVLRTYSQATIDEFARLSACPVINGLSDELHPCQALADVFTIREVFGETAGRRLVYVGDGNNVAASLAAACGQLGLEMTLCTPAGYELRPSYLTELKQRLPAAEIHYVSDPFQAVRQADIVYTDVWASMGQEAEAETRKTVFAPYQVNARLMAAAPPHCRFMHCLPARRGWEVTDEVVDGPQSIVFQQAENRMHLAKGLLAWLMC